MLLRALGLELQEQARGWQGYSNRATAWDGDIAVFWNPERPDMGSYIVVRGGGFERMEAEGQDAHGFCLYLYDNGGRGSRVDLASDDRTGLLDLSLIRAKWERREYKTLPGPLPRSHMGHIEGHSGETFYFPSLTSKTGFVRIYDKQAERIASGHDDPGHWVRVELAARHKRAQQAFEWYVKRDTRALVALTRRYVDFVDPGADSNKARWPASSWWSAFWQGIERDAADTTLAPDGRSAEEKDMARLQWEHDTVIPRAARRYVRNGGDMDAFMAELRAGLERDMLKHPEAYGEMQRETLRREGIPA